MTDRIDHRAAAEGALTDADEWGRQAEEPTPEVGELTCLAYSAVHALLAIHDALTASDRYAANEERQREEAEPGPLDEDDHRDRLAADSRRIVRHGQGHWHTPATSGTWCDADCTEMSLRDWARTFGPLTLAPDTAQDAAGGDLSAPEGESGAEVGGEAGDAQEPLLCPECGIAGDSIDEHNARGCRYVMCDCKLSPSDIARVLIAEAAKPEQAVEQAGGGRG